MDFNRLLDDLFQALDPVKRIGLRALLHELTATRDIPSVNQAILERAPAVVGADLWRQCCERGLAQILLQAVHDGRVGRVLLEEQRARPETICASFLEVTDRT